MKQFALLTALLFLTSCSLLFLPQEPESVQEPPFIEESLESCSGTECLQMEKELCDQAVGYWNECGSPCLGTEAEVCIQVCSAQCECGEGKYNCPEDYSCRIVGNFKTERGACVKT